MKVVCLWSGGKDSCLACYKAKSEGYSIGALFNFVQTNGQNSLSHGLPSKLIFEQAAMTGLPLIQKAMPQKTYRQEFKRLITEWKNKEAISGIVFGDIYLQEHKDWIDKVCQELQVKAILPLWKIDTKKLIEEFIAIGFQAIVVATRADLLGRDWLGRKIDKKFIAELGLQIDPCGENGEFHTFVYNGPLFKEELKFRMVKRTLKDNHWFLELGSFARRIERQAKEPRGCGSFNSPEH